MPDQACHVIKSHYCQPLGGRGKEVVPVQKMASADGERGPTAAELLLMAEMEQVLRDDWENPMHSWCALVAAFASKNPYRISRMIRLAKTSPWTQAGLEKELETALGQQNMLDAATMDYREDFQKAYDLEEEANWQEEQQMKQQHEDEVKTIKERQYQDALEWENMHPPRYEEEVASTQVIYEPEDEHSDQAQAGSSDQPLC